MRRIAIGFAAALAASGCQLIVDSSDLVLPDRADAAAKPQDAAVESRDAAVQTPDASTSEPDAAALPDAGPGCTEGLSCTPGNPCHKGATSCTSGPQTCTDTAENQPNGTSCGSSLVCNAGTCVTCVADEACSPTNPCHMGKTSCDTGAPVCTDTGTNAGSGTGCGTDLYCYAGQCQACSAGMTCEPANPCHGGTTACTTGAQTCVDSGNTFSNGTPCGQDKVCNGGACVTCVANVSCPLPNPCKTGMTSCDTGTSKCIETGALGVGETCGVNKVCNTSATCVSCTAGLSCTSSNPCHSAETKCETGAQVCTDTGNLPNGSDCGTNMVCNGGDCVSCIAGQACTSSNACHSAKTACNTGAQVCTDTGNLADGTECGADNVCNGGSCVPCVTATACIPANPCHVGSQSCTTGSPVCLDTAADRPDGFICGTYMDCCAGACVDQNHEWANWPLPPDSPTNYTDNGDGTVKDNETGLIWQQVVPAADYTQTEASAYCAGLILGGRTGWRLPTVIEWLSIVDNAKSSSEPQVNETAFPNSPFASYWCSTPHPDATAHNYGWYIDHGGTPGGTQRTVAAKVRCVY